MADEPEGTPTLSPLYTGGGSRPIPDPTDLTTKLVNQGISNLKDYVEARLDRLDKELAVRKEDFDNKSQHVNDLSSDRHKLVESQIDRLATLTDTKINAVKELIEKTGELNNTALQAAFAAAKEAVGAAQTASALANTKMEATFTKNFDSVNQLITTIQESLGEKVGTLQKVFDDKITDIKDTMAAAQVAQVAAQNRWQGKDDQRTDTREVKNSNIAVYACLLAAAVCLIEGIGLILALTTHGVIGR
jgi:hypothetical protein